jgi:hypothetical protein
LRISIHFLSPRVVGFPERTAQRVSKRERARSFGAKRKTKPATGAPLLLQCGRDYHALAKQPQ